MKTKSFQNMSIKELRLFRKQIKDSVYFDSLVKQIKKNLNKPKRKQTKQ